MIVSAGLQTLYGSAERWSNVIFVGDLIKNSRSVIWVWTDCQNSNQYFDKLPICHSQLSSLAFVGEPLSSGEMPRALAVF